MHIGEDRGLLGKGGSCFLLWWNICFIGKFFREALGYGFIILHIDLRHGNLFVAFHIGLLSLV